MSSVRFFAVLGSFCLLAFGFYLLEGVLTPFIVAWVLAYLLVPVIDLMSHRMPRWLSILVVFAALLAVLAGVMFGLIPALRHQISVFLQQLPSLMEHIDKVSTRIMERLHIHVNAVQISKQIQDALFKLGSRLVGAPGALVNTAAQLVEMSIFIALVPVVSFYLLRDWHDLTAGIESFLRNPGRRVVERIFHVSDQVLRRFIHGELLVMLCIGLMYTTGYMIADISLGLVLGMLAGVVSVIPFASFALAGIPAIVIAIAQFHDFAHPFMIILTIAVTELISNAFLVPLLVGRFVSIHPAAVLLLIFVGGALFGIMGMILAMPAVAVANAYWRQFAAHEPDEE